MAEDEPGDDPSAATGAPADAAALAIALGHPGKLDPRAAAYLEEQTVLAHLQIKHFEEEHRLAIEAARRKRFGDRFRNGFLAIAALLAAGVAVLVGAMAVDAANDHGLVIDAFSVPPDLSATGLTGDVVASRLRDRLSAMQAATESERPADSYEYNWGSHIKVQIPETGISFGELQDLLRDKLGHMTHIGGEVLRTSDGISITARWGDALPQTFTGRLNDFDNLVQQSAEAVYRVSQPFRYAEYVEQQGHTEQAAQLFLDLVSHGPAEESGWALAHLGFFELNEHGRTGLARRYANLGMRSGNVLARVVLINVELWSGHDEIVLEQSKLTDAPSQVRAPGTTELFFEVNRLIADGYLAGQIGDFKKSAADLNALAILPGSFSSLPGLFSSTVAGSAGAAYALALDHDPTAAQREFVPYATTDDVPFLKIDADQGWLSMPVYWTAAQRGDWSSALTDARACDAWLRTHAPKHGVYDLLRPVLVVPLEALALARTGDTSGAKALIGTTAEDCYLCLRVRGQIAALMNDSSGVDRWFGKAVRQAPSIPFAFSEWGAALLREAQYDAAIAKFEQAHAKGPHFADPLEMWGEALMEENRSDLALAKFAEADKYAPNWGRLHLEWGKALLYTGDRTEAQKQFGLASTLDLSAVDRAALVKLKSHHSG